MLLLMMDMVGHGHAVDSYTLSDVTSPWCDVAFFGILSTRASSNSFVAVTRDTACVSMFHPFLHLFHVVILAEFVQWIVSVFAAGESNET